MTLAGTGEGLACWCDACDGRGACFALATLEEKATAKTSNARESRREPWRRLIALMNSRVSASSNTPTFILRKASESS